MFHTVSSWYFSQRFGYIHGATKSEHWMCWECVESVKKTFSSINGVASSNVTPLTSWNFGCRSLKGTVTIVFHLCSHFSHVLRIMYDWANNTCKVIKEIRLTFIKGKKKACIMAASSQADILTPISSHLALTWILTTCDRIQRTALYANILWRK